MAEDPSEFVTGPNTGSKASGRHAKRATSVDAHLGHRVRFRRMSLNLSQEKLGEEVGLTFQQIQKYEKGTNRISASTLFGISQVLMVKVGYFFEGLLEPANDTTPGFAEEQPDGYMTEFLSSREGIELNRAFLKIPDPKVRRRMIDLVRSMAAETDGSDKPG